MTRTGRIVSIMLFVLVLLSLSLNGFLIWQWLNFQRQVYGLLPVVQSSLSQAAVDLESFQESTIEFEVNIQQEIPIRTEILLNKTIEVPIKTSIPISQTVDTTVAVPIAQLGVSLPVEVSVPLNMEVPIDLQVPVRLEESVPISNSVPIRMNVPIAIKISDTELGVYVERLRATLESIQKTLSDIER